MITADLTGRVALVTGGASGIGLVAVELFAHCGATVAMNSLADDPRAEQERERLSEAGLHVIPAPGNVAIADEAQAMVEEAIAKLGRLDILINNAATPGAAEPIEFANLDAMTEEFWGLLLSTNLVGPFRCARAAAGSLRQSRGAIINTASVAGLGRRGSSIAYAASKAGLINLTKSLARALAPEVRVNAVAPGLIETPWTERWSEDRRRSTLSRTLLGRLGRPADVAEAMLYLAAGAAYMTGETIVLDGGAA